jgi:transposase
MYVRCQKLKGEYRRAVLICHSVRQGKKVSQKTLKYFGVAHSEKELKALRKLAQLELKRLSLSPNETRGPSTINWGAVREEERVVEGLHDIFGPLFDRLQFASFLSPLRYRQLRDITLARIASPSSKCQTAELLSRRYARPLSPNQIYRLMDYLTPFADRCKEEVFKVTRHLAAQQKIDILFFDVTTLYFESQKPDALRDFGYSKDHKIGETQVVLALATTCEGLPIGYSLFSGRTAEVTTLLRCLEEWRQTIKIDNAVVVADRAMMAENNLLTMEQQNIKYIVAAKLKKLPAKIREQILARKGEELVLLGQEQAFVQEHTISGRRLIVSYSTSRALKDQKDRARLLAKLQEKIRGETDPCKLVSNRGYLKFLDKPKKGQVVLNEQKIVQESRWDGLHGVVTNDFSSSKQELLQRYKQLWVIEESFRINKHTLAMRPIFHFKPQRVEMHVLICYLAFALTRYAQHQLKAYGAEDISIERMRDELLEVQTSIVKVDEEIYRIPSKPSQEAQRIYRAFGMSRPLAATQVLERSKCSGTKKMQPSKI